MCLCVLLQWDIFSNIFLLSVSVVAVPSLWDRTCTTRFVPREHGDTTQMPKQRPGRRLARRLTRTLTQSGAFLSLATLSRILVALKKYWSAAKMTCYKERVFRSAATQQDLSVNVACTAQWWTPTQIGGFLILSTETDSLV